MIYVLSDIHGNEQRFDSIIEKLNLQTDDCLYVLGDVIDRHPGGMNILTKIMEMPNVKMLLGNHEYMMLEALGYPYGNAECSGNPDWSAMTLWYLNGGKITHDAYKSLDHIHQKNIIEFLRGLPVNVDLELGGKMYKLVHGAPTSCYTSTSEFRDSTHYAVWKRWETDSEVPDGYIMIFGHTPTEHFQRGFPMKPWYGEGCIGIDCGCGYPEFGFFEDCGRLACIRLDDGKEFYSNKNTV